MCIIVHNIQPNNYYIWQALPITTDVVSSNLDRGEVYNIMW
jgi:hypothetical protein